MRTFPCILAIPLAASIAVPASAEITIRTRDGRTFKVPVAAQDVASIEFGEPAPAPAPQRWPTRWKVVFDGSTTYTYGFTWTADSFSGRYVGLDNPSVFTGKVATEGGRKRMEYTQRDARRPNFVTTYSLVEVTPGAWSGTYADTEGRKGKVELKALE